MDVMTAAGRVYVVVCCCSGRAASSALVCTPVSLVVAKASPRVKEGILVVSGAYGLCERRQYSTVQ
jgi:hypothetical protein